MSAVPTTRARAAVDAVTLPRTLVRRLALPLLFVAATAFHAWQSRGHATPMVFDDELIYAKLSQSIAAGHWLSVRGESFFFPAFLAPLVQAPVWLLHSMTDAYTAAKVLNAALMSSAVFPAYWLARRLVRPSFALFTAGAAVATPAMVYHAFLMSEALAYPMFLLAVAVLAKALEDPSRRISIAVPLVCALAIATRIQFIVVPFAYFLAVLVSARGNYRRHLLPVGLTAFLVAALVVIPGALGTYGGASQLRPPLGSVAHWTIQTGALLPYLLGLAVVPGALLGLVYMLARPRNHLERGLAALIAGTTLIFLAQAAVVSSAEAHRPLERYLFYCTPLVFLAFFAYVERGAPRRFAYVAAAFAVALGLSQFQLTGLTGTTAYFFDGVTLTGFARVAYMIGLTNASLLYALLPLGVAVLTLVLPLRRRGVPELFAALAIGLSLAAGIAVYTTDRLATAWAARTFGGSSGLNWLDRSGLGPARHLALPNSNIFARASLESWNRDIRGVVVLATDAPDRLPEAVAHVRMDGTMEIDGAAVRPQLLVVNVAGSAIDLQGTVVARPRPDLVAYRIPARAKVRSLTWGLAPDGWAGSQLKFRVWGAHPSANGRYELTLALPRHFIARRGELHLGVTPVRRFTLRPGRELRLSIPALGTPPTPLKLLLDVPGTPLDGRVLGARVLRLRYVAGRQRYDGLGRRS